MGGGARSSMGPIYGGGGASEGWAGRVAWKASLGTAAGVAVGLTAGAGLGRRAARGALGAGLSCGLASVSFAALQEGCRFLRNEDSWANSLLAGAGAGGPLFALHCQ